MGGVEPTISPVGKVALRLSLKKASSGAASTASRQHFPYNVCSRYIPPCQQKRNSFLYEHQWMEKTMHANLRTTYGHERAFSSCYCTLLVSKLKEEICQVYCYATDFAQPLIPTKLANGEAVAATAEVQKFSRSSHKSQWYFVSPCPFPAVRGTLVFFMYFLTWTEHQVEFQNAFLLLYFYSIFSADIS